MDRQKKVLLWAVGVIGTLSVLLLVFILLLPTLINLDRIREKIVATISEKVGAELEFQRVDLSFFPRPRVMVHQGTLSVSGKISGNLESLNIYPEILPMLRGRMRVARLYVQNPNITIEVPEGPRKKEESPKVFSPETIDEEVTSILALMAMKAPGLILVVEEGKLNFSQGGRTIYWFRDIQARIGLPPENLEYTARKKLEEKFEKEGINYRIIMESSNIDGLPTPGTDRSPLHLYS